MSPTATHETHESPYLAALQAEWSAAYAAWLDSLFSASEEEHRRFWDRCEEVLRQLQAARRADYR